MFDEGNLHAPDVYKRMEAMGFQITRESDRPVQYVVKDATISGRPDGRVVGFRGERFEQPLVLEIKSMAPYTWDKIATLEDLKHADAYYVRGYLDQLYLYELLDELPTGVIVAKNKVSGLLRWIPVPLDYEKAEAILNRIERIKGYVDRKEEPAPIPYDEGVCGRCPFNHVCWPSRDYGQGLQLFDDAQLLEDIEQRQKLKEGAKEYDSLDASIKKRLKRLGTFEAAAIGRYLIERSEVPVKAYSVAARTDVRFKIQEATDKAIAETRKAIE